MEEQSPGHFEAKYLGPEMGLYRLVNGEHEAVVGLGPAAPREFEQTIATDAILAPVLESQRGGSFAIEEGLPVIRAVRPGRPAAGKGWLGITPRGAYEVRDVARTPILPAWLVLIMTSLLVLGGWLREGRR